MDGAAAATGDRGAADGPFAGNSSGPPAVETVEHCHVECKECGLTFSHLEVFKSHLHQHSLEDDEDEGVQTGNGGEAAAEPVPGRDLETSEDGEKRHSGVSKIQDGGCLRFPDANKTRKAHECSICGKVYSYQIAFEKHRQLHEREKSTAKTPSVQNLPRYECPHCGMCFIRQTRLLSHLKIHPLPEPPRPKALAKCDPCNREFTTMKSWRSHEDVHRQNPLWCLICAKGFRDEDLLDRHLQRIHVGKHKCDICCKCFFTSTQLSNHHSKHAEAKSPIFVGSGTKPPGTHAPASSGEEKRIQKSKFLTCIKEETQTPEGLRGDPKTTRAAWKDEPSAENVSSEESDCGEPDHGVQLPEAGGGDEVHEAKVRRVHKYWEWECFECDKGFDDVEKLHLHYVKHATGELPLPHYDEYEMIP